MNNFVKNDVVDIVHHSRSKPNKAYFHSISRSRGFVNVITHDTGVFKTVPIGSVRLVNKRIM